VERRGGGRRRGAVLRCCGTNPLAYQGRLPFRVCINTSRCGSEARFGTMGSIVKTAMVLQRPPRLHFNFEAPTLTTCRGLHPGRFDERREFKTLQLLSHRIRSGRSRYIVENTLKYSIRLDSTKLSWGKLLRSVMCCNLVHLMRSMRSTRLNFRAEDYRSEQRNSLS
jgi:hypothetical protein